VVIGYATVQQQDEERELHCSDAFFLMDDPLRLYLSFNHILSSESCDTVCGQLSNK
jgi:hypothetical protein